MVFFGRADALCSKFGYGEVKGNQIESSAEGTNHVVNNGSKFG